MGFKDSGILLKIANQPFFGDHCHSWVQADSTVALAHLRANALDVLIGVPHASWVASFANLSALSFPQMLQWLGHHAISIMWVMSSSRNFAILQWNLAA